MSNDKKKSKSEVVEFRRRMKGFSVLGFLFCHKAEILMRDSHRTEGKFCALCMGLLVIAGPDPRAEYEAEFV